MTETIVIETVASVLNTIGMIGAFWALYQYLLKRAKKKGYHILAYSFFILACSDALLSSYIIMMIDEVLAIICFKEWRRR